MRPYSFHFFSDGNQAAKHPIRSELITGRSLEYQCEPIFVVGSYRSATSALTWAIGQHPDVFPLEETNWIGPLAVGLAGAFQIAGGASRSFNDEYDVDRDAFFEHFVRGINSLNRSVSLDKSLGILLGRASGRIGGFDHRFQLLRSRMNPKRQWVDGTPENSGYTLPLADLFPGAKFVCIVRDPRQVANSLVSMKGFGDLDVSPAKAYNYWESLTQRSLESAVVLGEQRMYVVKFDTLTSSPDEVMRAIFYFIGLPPYNKIADVFQTRVNSSFDRREAEGMVPASPRHEEIYQGIIEGKRLNDLPWSRPFEASRDHLNHQVQHFIKIFKG